MSGKILFDSIPITIDRDFATHAGLNEAIVLQQMHYWLKENEGKGRNFREYRYWTYNPVSEWHKQLPFLTEHAVRKALESLRKSNILITANFNKSRVDRTLWYSIDYEALDKYMQVVVAQSIETSNDEKRDESQQMQTLKTTNANVENNKCKSKKTTNANVENNEPIPNNTNQSLKNKDIYIVQSEELWKMYPRKKGRADSLKKLPTLIKTYGYDQIKRCIERYSREVKDREQEYILLGSTFFNKRYMDYLDEAYEEAVQAQMQEDEPDYIDV